MSADGLIGLVPADELCPVCNIPRPIVEQVEGGWALYGPCPKCLAGGHDCPFVTHEQVRASATQVPPTVGDVVDVGPIRILVRSARMDLLRLGWYVDAFQIVGRAADPAVPYAMVEPGPFWTEVPTPGVGYEVWYGEERIS